MMEHIILAALLASAQCLFKASGKWRCHIQVRTCFRITWPHVQLCVVNLRERVEYPRIVCRETYRHELADVGSLLYCIYS